jgi:hypothetical protein
MSRDPHQPTEESRRMVRFLAGAGLSQDDISAIIGCSEKTLRLYYRNELDEGLADANAAIVAVLLALIRGGDVIAQIFYDKCRGGKRETPQAVEKTSNYNFSAFTPPCYDLTRCDRALEYMWRGRFLNLSGLSRQEAIAAIRAKIADLKAVPKWVHERRRMLLEEYYLKPRGLSYHVIGGSDGKKG